MKSVIKILFAHFTGIMLFIALFLASGCSKSSLDSEFEQSITYPEIGKLGLKNILAEGFLEGKRLGLDEENNRLFEYSVKAILPAGNSSLKIVIKSENPRLFICRSLLPPTYPPSPPCLAKFDKWYEICPECGEMNTLEEIIGANSWGGYYSGYDENWIISRWDNNLQGNTWTVYDSGKPADAIVTLSNDFIIEYYENGAKEPTKVKEVKVID